MTAHSYDVTVADFDEKVLAASQHALVIVDFWAPWCQPCQVLKPILEKLAAEYGGRFILAKINSDENQEIAVQYGVRGIPAVKAFIGGEMVNEFSGALPEGQVRDFIDALIPSPAEPLRQEALAAHARGDLNLARTKMAEAIKIDPRSEIAYLDFVDISLDAGALDEAKEVLDAVGTKARDAARVESLRARLQLAATAGNADIAALAAAVEAAPADLDARLELANALAAGGDYRGAFDNLLQIVKSDKTWNDEAGRKTMLTLFGMLGAQPQHDDLVREFRIALARTLN